LANWLSLAKAYRFVSYGLLATIIGASVVVLAQLVSLMNHFKPLLCCVSMLYYLFKIGQKQTLKPILSPFFSTCCWRFTDDCDELDFNTFKILSVEAD